jgi:hypothetical protein
MHDTRPALMACLSKILLLVDSESHQGFDQELSMAKKLLSAALSDGDLNTLSSGLHVTKVIESKIANMPGDFRQEFCDSFCNEFHPSAEMLALIPVVDEQVVEDYLNAVILKDVHPLDDLSHIGSLINRLSPCSGSRNRVLKFLINKSSTLIPDVSYKSGYDQAIGEAVAVMFGCIMLDRHTPVVPYTEVQSQFLDILSDHIEYLWVMGTRHSEYSSKSDKLSPWFDLLHDAKTFIKVAEGGSHKLTEFIFHRMAHRIYKKYIKHIVDTGFLPGTSLVSKYLIESFSLPTSNYWKTILHFHFESLGRLALPDNFFELVSGNDVCELLIELSLSASREYVPVCTSMVNSYVQLHPLTSNTFRMRLPDTVLLSSSLSKL